jgi:hypothetical protein
VADRKNVRMVVGMRSQYAKDGEHTYKCDVEGTEIWIDAPMPLQERATYIAGTVDDIHQNKTKTAWYAKAKDLKIDGAAPEWSTSTTPRTMRAVPSIPIMAELHAICSIIGQLKQATEESTTVNTCLMEEFRRGAIERMVEYQGKELGKKEPPHEEDKTQDAADELPPDDEIPF